MVFLLWRKRRGEDGWPSVWDLKEGLFELGTAGQVSNLPVHEMRQGGCPYMRCGKVAARTWDAARWLPVHGMRQGGYPYMGCGKVAARTWEVTW